MLDDDLWWATVNYNYNYMYNNNRLGSGKAHQGHINHVISGQSKIVLYHVMLREFILQIIYTGNSSCDDYILMILELPYHAHHTNWSLGL